MNSVLETVSGARENVRLRFPELPDVGLSVREFEIEEGISRLFRAQIRCVSPHEELDLSAMVGARLELELSGHVERSFRGLCQAAHFARVSETAEGLATYVITLVPTLWRLTQRVQNRLFQHTSIPAIVKAILDEWAIEHEWRIDAATYPPIELRTQYGESDFAFVSRLLEEIGVSFWFVDAGDAASRLVLCDAPHAGEVRAGPPIPFADDVTLAQGALAPQHVTRVELREESRPGRFTARDYDFMRPRRALFTHADAARSVEHAHEQYRFVPGLGLAEDPAASGAAGPHPIADEIAVARGREDYARLRVQRSLEAAHGDRRVVTYEASVNDLSPGVVFRIGRHPRPDLGEDQGLLCVRHRASGKVADPGSWVFEGAAVSTAAPFRPPQITPKPRIYGLQTAVVVGQEGARSDAGQKLRGAVGVVHPAAVGGAEAAAALADNTVYVDEHGRVRVQFPWDREHGFDKRSSIWMRVSQGWAGAGYGLFTIPRVGHEVLVAFLDGDPDSPLIVGRVHNAADPVPYPLPGNMTVSTWKSASTPTGDGFNELRFDDASGREHVYLQAQKDMDHLVKNDHKQAVGGSASRYVQKHDAAAVGGSRSELINLTEQRAVGLTQANVVGLHRTSHVGVEDSTMVGTRWAVTIARGMTSRLVGQLEQVAGTVGGVIRSAATTVLGGIPGSPVADAAASPLADLGAQLFDSLKSALRAAEGYPMDPGPPPTSIEVVDRRITLTTGEASIVLDGPNVTISAQGNIVLHAMDHVSVLSEKEIAVGGREKVAVVSATGDLILQAKNDLHLNPFSAGQPPRDATRLQPPTPRPLDPERCAVCAAAVSVDDQGGRSCPVAAGSIGGGGGSLPAEEPPGGEASPAADALAGEALSILAQAQRYGFTGEVLEHAISAASAALDAAAPSYRRVLTWLLGSRHLDQLGYDALLTQLDPQGEGGFVGLLLRWWIPGAERPGEARWAHRDGELPRVGPVDPGRLCLDVCLPMGLRTAFINQVALTELVALLQLGTLPPERPEAIIPADELPITDQDFTSAIERDEVSDG